MMNIRLRLIQIISFKLIKQWTTIRQLEIYGIDDSDDDLSLHPELSDYLESLNYLTTLVLYGIGAATSIAYTLFRHDGPDRLWI